MASEDIGFSFTPGATSRLDMERRGQGNLGMSPQQEVRMLSLRVPDRPSPTAITSLPLLQSQGGAAPGAAGLQSLIQALIQAFRPAPGVGGGVVGGTAGPGPSPFPSGPSRQFPEVPGRVELPASGGQGQP